ncbi:MAG: hypothetical protein DI637_07065 [Citromicrobium sp.]|nr:MAG: hypothetical protein DI637_07065 [Citromicrobium sp.]
MLRRISRDLSIILTDRRALREYPKDAGCCLLRWSQTLHISKVRGDAIGDLRRHHLLCDSDGFF